MDVSTFEQLLTATGHAALAAARDLSPTTARYPACLDRLRKHFPDALSRAALDTVMLREKARAKFGRADEMFFTREALEMASSEPVATFRAGRFASFGRIADLCCGIGGDAIALALAGRMVTAIDSDPLRLRMAEANVALHGGTGRFVCGDVLTADLTDCGAAYADPGRRPGGRRTLSLHESEPPVPALAGRFPAGFPLGVKVAPGLRKDELSELDADAEFISLGGELKECVLWFGPLRGGRRATVLPGPHTLSGDPDPVADVSPVGAYVLDPDPAVTRADLAGELARQLGASLCDHRVALLTCETPVRTPFATAYRVVEVLPFQPRRVGDWLKTHDIGRVTPIKRGLDVDTDQLQARWKLRGDGHHAVILTRLADQPTAIVCDRLETTPGEPDGPPGPRFDGNS